MADATVLKTVEGVLVWVRIPSPAPIRGPIAQGQSTSLITTWLQVRILLGPPNLFGGLDEGLSVSLRSV